MSMSAKYIIAGAIGGALIRKGMDHLSARHPEIANAAALPAHVLYKGAETFTGFDLSRPDTWLRTAANLISPRPQTPDDAPPPIPAAVIAELKHDGWIIGGQGDQWNMLWAATWRAVHDVYGLASYTVRRYGSHHWLLTRRDARARAGWLIENDTQPLRKNADFVEGRWCCPVVTTKLEGRVYISDVSALTSDEVHELAWPASKGRAMYTLADGASESTWAHRLEAHEPAIYLGAELVHRARWTRHVRAWRAFNVMLFGPPGCGKTTLLRQWFAEENLRVIEVHASDLTRAGGVAHQLFWWRPDVILIEDFDRIGEEHSGSLLWLFEHTCLAHRPMIFATSNHPSKIADAFWRPGRFDQVIEISPPVEGAARDHMLRDMAQRFGLAWDILALERRQRAHKIATELSIAHLEAYMQRLAEDPASLDGPGDRTFEPPVKWRAS